MTLVYWSGSSKETDLKGWKDNHVFYTVAKYLVKYLFLVSREAYHLPNELAALEEISKQIISSVH